MRHMMRRLALWSLCRWLAAYEACARLEWAGYPLPRRLRMTVVFYDWLSRILWWTFERFDFVEPRGHERRTVDGTTIDVQWCRGADMAWDGEDERPRRREYRH